MFFVPRQRNTDESVQLVVKPEDPDSSKAAAAHLPTLNMNHLDFYVQGA